MNLIKKILKEAKVYHGTDTDFHVYDITKSQKMGKFGIWFTEDKEFAEMFGSIVKEANIELNNPKVITAEQWNNIRDEHAKDDNWFNEWKKQLISKGHDGLKVLGGEENVGRHVVKNPTIYAVWDIKKILSESENIIVPKQLLYHTSKPIYRDLISKEGLDG